MFYISCARIFDQSSPAAYQEDPFTAPDTFFYFLVFTNGAHLQFRILTSAENGASNFLHYPLAGRSDYTIQESQAPQRKMEGTSSVGEPSGSWVGFVCCELSLNPVPFPPLSQVAVDTPDFI